MWKIKKNLNYKNKKTENEILDKLEKTTKWQSEKQYKSSELIKKKRFDNKTKETIEEKSKEEMTFDIARLKKEKVERTDDIQNRL